MIVHAVSLGVPVSAAGTVVHVAAGTLLVADTHADPDVLTAPLLGPDVIALPLSGRVDVEHGATVTVTGRWTGRGIDVRTADPVDLPWASTAPRAPRVTPHRPAGVVGPPGVVEQDLLADGTITSRLPYGDGTVHVVADDLDRVRAALAPVHGDRLRVHRAVFSREQRATARAAMDVADALGVVCAVGSTFLDHDRPAETVHTLEVGWVPAALADALRDVPDGLVVLTAHVTVIAPG